MLGHERVFVREQPLEQAAVRGGPRVADRDREVAQQSAALGALQRAPAEANAERLGVEDSEVLELGRLGAGPRLEGRPAAAAPLAVPRADVLADVAAENVASQTLAQRLGDRALELDRQVADAARGVEHVGRREGLRGAGVEARGAAAAHVGAGRVGGHLEVGDELAQEEPGALLRVQQAGVLAERAEAGRRGPGLLRDRSGVDVGARLERAGLREQPLAQPLEQRAHHVVVVVAPRVAGDPAAAFRRLARVRVRRVVLKPDREHGARPRERGAEIAAPGDLLLQIAHLTGVAAGDPLGEEREIRRRVGTREAGEVESGLERERLGALGER